MQTLPTGSQSGFTLLELLVAITIGSLILSAVYGTYSTMMMAKKKTIKTFKPLRFARYTFDFLSRDVRAMYPLVKSYDIQCQGNECHFPVLGEDGRKLWVRYYMEEDGRLIRKEFSKQESSKELSPLLSEICVSERVSSAIFKTVKRKTDRNVEIPQIFELNLIFEDEHENGPVYSYRVLLEVKPDA